MLLVLQIGADRHDDLSEVNPCHCALVLPKGTLHACLEPVNPSTGQHLVDAEDMERVEPHLDVEAVCAAAFHHVLVGTNPSRLQNFRGKLLILIRVWPQNENSSTFAFFCPRSKMWILASGTPWQKQDFGYGLFLQYR